MFTYCYWLDRWYFSDVLILTLNSTSVLVILIVKYLKFLISSYCSFLLFSLLISMSSGLPSYLLFIRGNSILSSVVV